MHLSTLLLDENPNVLIGFEVLRQLFLRAPRRPSRSLCRVVHELRSRFEINSRVTTARVQLRAWVDA